MKQEMIGSVPGNILGMLADLMHKLQHGVVTPVQLDWFLKGENPFAITDIRQEWQEFYRKYFRMAVDFSDVVIPDDPGGFERVIFIPKGLTFARVINALRKQFKVWLYIEDLDKEVKENIRTSNASYAIRIRSRQEADEELKNLSANQLKQQNINCVTLLERLVDELKWFVTDGKHMDVVNWTLCAGSRCSGGNVPGVRWSPVYRKLHVHWCHPDDALGHLRARPAVSS